MSIRKKLFLFIFFVSLLSIGVIAIVFQAFVRFNIKNIEDIQVKDYLQHAYLYFDDRINRIDTFTTDYAGWDDTYNFIQDGNQEYIDSNLVNETLITTKLNFMLFYDTDNNLVHSIAVDLADGIGIFTPENLLEKMKENPELIEHNNTNSFKKGFIVLDNGEIVMLSSRPILKSSKQGPIMGTLVFGEYLDQATLLEIENKLGKNILVTTSTNQSESELLIERINNNTIIGKYIVSDLIGNNFIEIEVEVPRTYLTESRNQYIYFILTMISIGILSYLAGLVYIEKIVVKPLNKIKEYLDIISENKDLSSRLETNGLDEINQVVEKINHMLEMLANYEVKLISLNEELKSENQNIENLITKRTAALKKEHAQLSATIDSIPDGIVIMDKDLQIISNNGVIYEILDIDSKEKLNYEKIHDLLSKDGSLNNFCKESLEYGKAVEKEIKTNNKEIHLYVTPIKYANSKEIIGLVLIIKDITNQKQLENAQENLINILSHELRTPIAVINGNIGLIRQDVKNMDDKLRKNINTVESSSRRLLKLVNNYLTLYKYEQNKLVFDIEEKVNIGTIIKDLIMEHRSEYVSKPITIENRVSEEIYAAADKTKIKLVIENVLVNAFKYTQEGTILVEAKTNKSLNKVIISISDSGIGISEKSKTQLFYKFGEANSMNNEPNRVQSKGIGLYLSKMLIEKMSGSIYLEKSEQNIGSTFRLELPISKD